MFAQNIVSSIFIYMEARDVEQSKRSLLPFLAASCLLPFSLELFFPFWPHIALLGCVGDWTGENGERTIFQRNRDKMVNRASRWRRGNWKRGKVGFDESNTLHMLMEPSMEIIQRGFPVSMWMCVWHRNHAIEPNQPGGARWGNAQQQFPQSVPHISSSINIKMS